MNIFTSKKQICIKLGITDPKGREAQKYVMGLSPVIDWATVNTMFYAALRNGSNQDQAYDVISDFNQLYCGAKFPISKKEFIKRRTAKAEIRLKKPNAPERKKQSSVDHYLENHNSKKFREENPEMVNRLVREVKKILNL